VPDEILDEELAKEGILDDQFMLEIEQILFKVSRQSFGDVKFTRRESMILEALRQNSESIMTRLYQALWQTRAVNPAGQEKIKNLIKAFEKICG